MLFDSFTAWRYGTNAGSQQTTMLAEQDAAMLAPTAGEVGQLGMGLSIMGAISGAVSSFYSAKSQRSALRFQADLAEINGRIAEQGAQSTLLAGQQQVGALTLRAGQLKSTQRAALAANGIDLGVGSAAEIQASTDLMKEIDKNTIEANAVRSAWGYRTQSTSLNNEARVRRATSDQVSPYASAGGSLLGSAGQVASSWYSLNKAGVR